MVGLGKVHQFRQGVNLGGINAAPGVAKPLNLTRELLFVTRPPRTIRRTGGGLSEDPVRVNQEQDEADGMDNFGFDVQETFSRRMSRPKPTRMVEWRIFPS